MTPTMHANNSPRKKALLVGMRYADNDRMTSDSELICCTLEEFRDRLIRQYGYSDEDIKIPELTGSTSTNMSREFILRAAMDTLVTGAGVGDRFIFYFVGHGSQQSMATKSFEAGGLDEVINLLDAPSGMTDPSAETNLLRNIEALLSTANQDDTFGLQLNGHTYEFMARDRTASQQYRPKAR